MNNLIKKHAKSFYWASFFLSKPIFNKCSSLYNFCRTLDDIVDDDKELEIKKKEKRLSFASIRSKIHAIREGHTADNALPIFLRIWQQCSIRHRSEYSVRY